MLLTKQTSVLTAQASAAQTVTFNSGILNVQSFRSFTSILKVTARSGTTPTLSVQWFGSDDPAFAVGYNLLTLSIGTHATFNSGSTIPSIDLVSFDLTIPYLRATCTIGGTTPSWTFSLNLHAYQS